MKVKLKKNFGELFYKFLDLLIRKIFNLNLLKNKRKIGTYLIRCMLVNKKKTINIIVNHSLSL